MADTADRVVMLKSSYSSASRVLSVLVAGVALFNLGRQYANIGLNGVFIDLIDFYQRLLFPIIDVLKSKVYWMVPDWNKNLTVLIVTICAIHARSLSRHFELAFDADAGQSDRTGKMPVVAQILIGLRIAFAFFAGAAAIRGRGMRLSPVTSGTITTAAFVMLVSVAVLVPYVRAVFAALLIVSALLLMTSVLFRYEGVKFTNKRVFAMQYLGAVFAAIALFALNRYAN
jgi:hypothetical protein